MPIKINHDPEPTLNLTPMIDIVFLLIIFFMVGTKFAEMERQIKIDLPAVKQFGAVSPAPEERVINVYRDGTITMDKMTFTLDELMVALEKTRSEYEGLPVLIRGDGDGNLKHAVKVMATCRDAGFHKIGIAVRPEKQISKLH
jgi:biopolymer transport protein ExbD